MQGNMTEKLLNKRQIAEILETTPEVAASILENAGVSRIDFGAGRSRGVRWLASAVFAAIQNIHHSAQSKRDITKNAKITKPPVPSVRLASMSASDIYDLTHKPCVQ